MFDSIAPLSLLDRIAARVGMWALRRLYGECEVDVRDEFPDEPSATCIGCDASRLIRHMEDMVRGR